MKPIFFSLILIVIFIFSSPINALDSEAGVRIAKEETKLLLLEKRIFACEEGSKGIDLCLEGKFEEAIEALNLAILHDPNRASFYSVRGMAYSQLGNPDKGIEDINTAIALDPKNAEFYNVRATTNFLLGKLAESMNDLITSAKLGDASAQEKLKTAGIDWDSCQNE